MAMAMNGLAKLIEELGELGQVIGKKLAAGERDDHPDGKGSLKIRLQDEIADVTAACEFVIRTHNFNAKAILKLTEREFNRRDGEGLIELAEDVGELVNACAMKIAAQDDDFHVRCGESLQCLMERKIANVLAACESVLYVHDLCSDSITQRADAKSSLFEQWHEDQSNMV
jgi:NTP pyrophosphatase (non-canonical NTP hydrolase)